MPKKENPPNTPRKPPNKPTIPPTHAAILNPRRRNTATATGANERYKGLSLTEVRPSIRLRHAARRASTGLERLFVRNSSRQLRISVQQAKAINAQPPICPIASERQNALRATT